jgi:hypothetical protein
VYSEVTLWRNDGLVRLKSFEATMWFEFRR